MKAYVVDHAGGPEVLQLKEIPTPKIKPGWARLKVLGFGINHSEIFTREGKSPSVQFPRVLGIEVVGEIDETSAPDTFKAGQRVVSIMGEMGRAYDGSYAEYVLVPNAQIYPVKTTLPLRDLVAVPETYYTAYGIVKSLQLKSTDNVLVRAATSGVGIAVLRLIRGFDPHIQVTGTTRAEDKLNALLTAGFDDVIIAADSEKLPAGVGRYDKIIDLIGPLSVKDSLQHLNPFGIVSASGLLGNVWTMPDFDPMMDVPNDGYLTGFYSGIVSGTLMQELFDFIDQYDVQVAPTKVFNFNEVAQAHAYLSESDGLGKVIVMVEP
ncbi:quinone oxidoreductase [Secundilactobacillus paracollinoides]|uniref:alcohol dehydrogenase catalytic domain-containing protein n=1 Tax=Secundilactobacillus paracollinoides TaxID=240427 RepID=UPI00081A3836|nr:zinc-binding dehydrogenase [Secundilactobacillus paracollinoides]ANZ63642.1 quinone oxidoreductase [Secundilactobacillus paracollinoides]